MSAFALPIPPRPITRSLHRPTERSATAYPDTRSGHTLSFGARLEPRYIFAAETLD